MEKNDSPKVADKYVEAETVSDDSDVSSLSNFTETGTETINSEINSPEVLIIEPFYGGSHKQLIDVLEAHLNRDVKVKKTCLFSLPAKKWHWRARTSALYFSQTIPKNNSYKVLFCSSVLNLAELIALRLDLASLFKVVYFHENQLVYPVRKHKERDYQYGYNQILSSLVADAVVFNSYYNMNSFLNNIDGFLKLQPDFRVKNLKKKLIPKCQVIYFPVEVPHFENQRSDILHIIWPHRWEHDKNPEMFFKVLFDLKLNGFPFRVSILGEAFQEVPEIFEEAKNTLKDEIIQFGRIHSKDDYYKVLRSGHVVVSTARHEFFGVSMLEAVMSGCYPLACNDLVYPELYPSECLYRTQNQLYKKLKTFCKQPYLAQVTPFLDGINKVKDLIQELEESFRESNNIGSSLILRCVLLRAENQNLFHKIDEKNRNLTTTLYNNKQWQLAVLSQDKPKSVGNESKRIACLSQSKTNFHPPLVLGSVDEVDILHKTIGDLQTKLRERDKRIELLCQKYLYLKTNKNKMESDLRRKISNLEKQLELTYKTLSEYQTEMEIITQKSLSRSKSSYEALFLQEKSRCSKLMFEKVRLNHEIKRLEEVILRQEEEEDEESSATSFSNG